MDNQPSDPPKTGLRHLADRAQARAGIRQARSYSRVVRWLRLIVPVATLVGVAAVFLTSQPQQATRPLDRADVVGSDDVTKNELTNPKFEGADTKLRPYTITALRATQEKNDPDHVFLEQPVADMTLGDNEWVAVKAQQGAFDQTGQSLRLTGQVRIFHDTGYEMEGREMTVSLKDQTVTSEQPVSAQGPAGTLEAQGMEARSADSVVIFKGPATLVLSGDAQ